MRRAIPLGTILLAAALVVPEPTSSVVPAPSRAGLASIAEGSAALVREAASAPGPVAAPGTSGVPSEAYLEAQAHAHDRLVLAPPRPVTVPLRPRDSDGPPSEGQRVPSSAQASGDAGSHAGGGAGGTGLVASHRLAQAGTTPSPTDAQPTAASVPPTSTASPTNGAQANSPVPAGPGREVYGFLPYWELADPTLTLDYSVLSTIAYFGVTASADGTLQQLGSDGTPEAGWTGWQSGNLTAIIDAAHAQGTRVALTIERFAWDPTGAAASAALLGSPAAQATLIGQIVAQVVSRGVDGVNLDFEPVPPGQAASFDALVRGLRAALDAARPGLELVVDVTGDPGNYDVPGLTAPGAADALFVMGYDYRGAGATSAASISPLASTTYYTDLTRTVGRYLTLTTPGHLLLGLPYYGRAWSTVSNTPNAATLPQNSQNGYSVAAPYDVAVGLAETNGRQWDAAETSAWTAYQRQNCDACPSVWRELYYDDAQSLAAKYQLVIAANLRGTGMWALGYDGTRPELTQLLRQTFGSTAPLPPTGELTVTAGGSPGNPPNAFSPNGDGVADTASLSWWVSEDVTGTLSIASGSSVILSTPVTSTSGSATWNGTTATGAPAPDGTYAVTLAVKGARGVALTLRSTVVVNRVLGFLRASPNRFYPQDGDRYAPVTRITFRLARATTSTLRILDAQGHVVRTAWYARRTPAGTSAWTWDGRGDTGAPVPQGDYTAQVVATGPAGRAFLARSITAAAYLVRTAVAETATGRTLVVNAWASEPMRSAPTFTLTASGQTLAGSVTSLGAGHYQAAFSGAALSGTGTVTISGMDAGGRLNRYGLRVSLGPPLLPTAPSPGPPQPPGASPSPSPSADSTPLPGASPPPAPSPGATGSPSASPGPTPLPSASPSPAPSPGPSPTPVVCPATITARCPLVRIRSAPDPTAAVVATVDQGATATAVAVVQGGTYTSSCNQLGTFQAWYALTVLDGQPLATPLFTATAFWGVR